MKKTKKKQAQTLTERQDLEFALEGFRDIARQAAADMGKNGLIISGSQGRKKVNPAAKIFRDAVKTIDSLRKRLLALDKEKQADHSDGEDLSFLDE